MNCTNCGATILDNAKFCNKCGSRVSIAQGAAATVTNEPHVNSSPACSGCGAALVAKARFCGNCGTSTAEPTATVEISQASAPGQDSALNCVACGATLVPNARFCGKCGSLTQRDPGSPSEALAPVADPAIAPQDADSGNASDPPATSVDPPPTTAVPPPQAPQASWDPPAASISSQVNASRAVTISFSLGWLNDIVSRREQAVRGQLVGGLTLASAALMTGLAAHTYRLVDGSTVGQLHARVWFEIALILAIISVGLLVIVRTTSEEHPTSPRPSDLGLALGLEALIALFAFVGLVLGLGNHYDAMGAWFDFATVWAFVALGWLLFSRPIPREWGFSRGVVIGSIVLGLAGIFALMGLTLAMGDSFQDFARGDTWLQLARVGALVGVGWLFGLQPPAQDA